MIKATLDLLIESLKIQAERYKELIDNKDLTHEQRKEFDSEIMQMYNVLSSLTNTSTLLTASELDSLKKDYQLKLNELTEKINSLEINSLTVNFDSLSQEQKDSLKGSNGSFEDLTQEQKDSLKGQDGLSVYQLAVNNGFQGSETEYLNSLKGKDGLDSVFVFDNLDAIQKNKIFAFIFESSIFTDLLQRITNLENNSGSTPTTPETPTTDFTNPFEIENSIYSFNKLSDNELLIRVVRTSQINEYNMLVTNLSLNVSDIEKIEYKVVKSFNPLEVSQSLEILNAPDSYETFTYLLDGLTMYPTSINSLNIEYMENLGDSFSNYDNLSSNVASELKAFVAVINGQLLIIADRNINISNYIENILITLKTGHSIDISNVSVLESGLLTGANRFADFNLIDYDSFLNDVSDLIPPSN